MSLDIAPLIKAAALFDEKHAGSGLSVCTATKPAGIVIGVIGSIDTNNSNDFIKFCELVVSQVVGYGVVIIDMSSLRYAASTGIGAVSTITVEAKRNGVKVHLCKVPKSVQEIMEMLGLWDFFSVIPSYEKAT
jgi:anti-anti-sigma factor